MAEMGRPTLYKDEYDEQAYKLALLGHTDEELAKFFEVDVSTINNWKIAHPNFFESIKKGKDIADSDITESLYKRARGFEKDAVKIFNNQGEEMVVPFTEYYPPDPTSMIFWLKNRQPKKWRDKHVTEQEGENTAPAPVINIFNNAPPLADSEPKDNV
jgi:hypothetical protein